MPKMHDVLDLSCTRNEGKASKQGLAVWDHRPRLNKMPSAHLVGFKPLNQFNIAKKCNFLNFIYIRNEGMASRQVLDHGELKPLIFE